MNQSITEILNSAKRAMLFLLPQHDSDVERDAAMQRAAKLTLEVTAAFIRAGRDDLAQRAAELAMDAQ